MVDGGTQKVPVTGTGTKPPDGVVLPIVGLEIVDLEGAVWKEA